MQIKNLPPTTIATIKKSRYDRIVEKHEGPETWNWEFDMDEEDLEEAKEFYKKIGFKGEPSPAAEFMEVGGAYVLLPVPGHHHPFITILHYFFSEDRSKIVLYLKDNTHFNDAFGSGFVAICDKFPDEEFYLATFYHEWFIIDYDPMADKWKNG